MPLLDETCRIAFSGLSHDLGKFAQRAGYTTTTENKKIHEQLYCPRNEYGFSTHIHAAYTGMAFHELEKWSPNLRDGDTTPFGQGGSDITDSMVNAAGRHHAPSTFLQWIVKTADCAASGFEREEARSEEIVPDGVKHDHITTRQWTLFEQVRLDRSQKDVGPIRFRKPLKAFAVDALFPQDNIEPTRREEGQKEYALLWEDFLLAGEKIPHEIKASWPLWLDTFDTLWLTYTHAIPSATAFGAKPDVSLYDHSKATAALSSTLWRWFHEQIPSSSYPNEEAALASMKNRSIRDQETLLLVQGDFFGIQNFIFSGHEKTNGKMAKILRGRSFYVSLLMEACALRILEELSLPSTSQITNAAGKFLIVAPNTPATIEKLKKLHKEFDNWFIQHTCAEAGIGLVWQSARLNDLSSGHFPDLMKSMAYALQREKLQRFDLCSANESPEVLPVDFSLGVCAWQGRWPADAMTDGLPSCVVSRDQIRIGQLLPRTSLLLLVKDEGRTAHVPLCDELELPLFGYRVLFADRKVFDQLVKSFGIASVRRCWDFSLPQTADEVLWHGFSRRAINSYIPRFVEGEMTSNPTYQGLDTNEIGQDRIKPFSWLSREDLYVEADGSIHGVDAIAHLKGDVDQLGRIFQEGLCDPVLNGKAKPEGRSMTFAKMAGLSRETNAFFAVYVPYLCQSAHPSMYTVFAGGDDFSFIGPRAKTQAFVTALHDRFKAYVAHNPEIHFSAGIAVMKPGVPVRTLSDTAESALSTAKASGRNAITIYGLTFPWEKWKDLKVIEKNLFELRERYDLSTSYLYSLFDLMTLASQKSDPRSAIWRSRLNYRTVRFVRDTMKKDNDIRNVTADILRVIGLGIETEGKYFRVPLTNLFYRIRRYC